MMFFSARDWIFMVAFLVAVTVIFVATGTVLGFVASGVVPAIDIAQMPFVTLGSLAHLSDPALAWPKRYQHFMPSSGWFYAGWALSLLLIWSATRLTSKRGGSSRLRSLVAGSRRDAESASWAKAKDLSGLFVRTATKGRLTIGKFGGRLVAAEERQSLLVAAPSQSGKTTGLVVPAILEWDGPVIATSVKGDLLDDTMKFRSKKGRVMIFDPTAATGLPHTQATPLGSCRTWGQSRQVAHWLTEAAKPAGIDDASFWYRQASKLLAPVLFSASREGRTMEDVVRILDDGPVAAAEVEAGLTGQQNAIRQWRAMQGREERQLSSIYATAELVVEVFADPTVADRCSLAEVTAADLLDGHANTLYLVAPVHEQSRLAPLFAMLIEEVVRVVYAEAAARRSDPGLSGSGAGVSNPLLLALDELANIAPIPDLDRIASTGAAQGIQLLSVVQDLAQLKERFGPLKAQTIVNNHRAKLIGSGMSDPDTLEYVQRVSGSAEYAQRSETVGEGRDSRTEGSTFRDLAPAHVVREQSPEEAVLIYGSLPPARLKLRPWFKDRALTAMAESSNA